MIQMNPTFALLPICLRSRIVGECHPLLLCLLAPFEVRKNVLFPHLNLYSPANPPGRGATCRPYRSCWVWTVVCCRLSCLFGGVNGLACRRLWAATGGSRPLCDWAGLLVDSALARAMYCTFHRCCACAEEFCVAPVLTLEHGLM